MKINKKILYLIGFIIAIIAIWNIYDAVRPKHNEFVKGADMNYPRAGHTATLLQDGTVLITGGGTNAAEIYYPDKNKFVEIPSTNYTSVGNVAVLMNDGKVFILEGQNAEIYNPNTQDFSIVSGMRYPHDSASLLSDGRVLIAGGGFNSLYAEIFDPKTNKFSLMNIVHTSSPLQVTLKNGNVLLAEDGGTDSVNSELFDAKQNKIVLIGKMHFRHGFGTATLLKNGNVLFAGGRELALNSNKCEIFDYKTTKFNIIDGLIIRRADHTATLLKTGKILITGGVKGVGLDQEIYSSVELYDPEKNKFTLLKNKMKNSRIDHTATLLKDGRVLITGGRSFINIFAGDKDTSSSEIYYP